MMKKAFTMAEILLSLTIIGVVAAITLPSLTGNINERTWNTQRKALYARMSQAISLMPNMNGYGEGSMVGSGMSTSTSENFAEAFLTEGLSKVLKINNICDGDHLQDCGMPEKYNTFTGKQLDFPKTNGELNCDLGVTIGSSYFDPKAAAFETQNGESIAVFYRPGCFSKDLIEEDYTYVGNFVCANFIYDLNGNKGPNTIGKDIGFITVLYPSDSVVVAPMILNTKTAAVNQKNVSSACKALDSDSRGPNIEEAISLEAHSNFILERSGNITTWSSSALSSTKGLAIVMGQVRHLDKTTNNFASYCVKR